MANHKSAKKRVKTSEKKRAKNRYQHKTTRTFLKKTLTLTDKEEVGKMVIQAASMLDKLVKRGIIHANKSARKKSKLFCHLNHLNSK